MKRVVFFILLAVFIVQCQGTETDQLINYNTPLSELLDSVNTTNKALTILIDKSDYILSIMIDSTIIKQYPVVLGGNPEDDKLREGDQCTPEGTFKIRDKYPHRSWSKFIWIDYPNETSWKKHSEAKRESKIPEDVNIGGEIGIHGVPNGRDMLIDMKINWTLGCISLKNKDINDFYPFVSKETIIIIRK